MIKLLLALSLLGALLCAVPRVRAEPSEPPVELGAVSWQRDFDAAAESARAGNKALLVLFQEVPG